MNNITLTLEEIAGKPVPEKLVSFLNQSADYNGETISNLPGWDPECEFEIEFSKESILELVDRHGDWLKKNSEADAAHYLPFSTLEEETDFLVVDISKEDCPILFADHESGQFILIKKNIDKFLASFDESELYTMDQLGELYQQAMSDYFEGKSDEIINTLGTLFDDNQVNPGIPSPYMQILPDALNLLAVAYFDNEQIEETFETLDLACQGIFCEKAFLNRIKVNLLTGQYETVLEQTKEGLSRFNSEYAQAFLNLYHAVALGAQEKEDEAIPFLNLLPDVEGKNDLVKVTPVAAMYTHILGNISFEEAFGKTAAVVEKMEE